MKGNYYILSKNKVSSNVVEKCVSNGTIEQSINIINELISNPKFYELLNDAVFYNYIIVCKLCNTKCIKFTK